MNGDQTSLALSVYFNETKCNFNLLAIKSVFFVITMKL